MSSNPSKPTTLSTPSKLTKDTVIKVENVSKKFCKNLQNSMLYGMKDIVKTGLGLNISTHILRKDEFWALDNISFELKRGEVLGIVGQNGSGKTTLLKLLNGIFMPDKGKIEINGKVGALIELGAGFHPMLTGRENIYINGAILGMKEKEINEKINSIIKFADIGEFLDAPVKYYSSGMFIRLGFAIAVHSAPDILLIDEILAVGDTAFRRKSAERMKEFIMNRERAIILISHNMQTVEAIAEKSILLNKGKILEYGKTEDVTAKYQLMFSKRRDKYVDNQEDEFMDGKQLELVKKYKDYSGNEIDIQKVWLESRGEAKTSFHGNEDVTACMAYKVKPETVVKNGFVWIAFINEEGVNCMGTQVRLGEEGMPETLPRTGIIKNKFSPIQLTTGIYKLSIVFFDYTHEIPYAQGHYGYIRVFSKNPAVNPGISSPVCWPQCKWMIDELQE